MNYNALCDITELILSRDRFGLVIKKDDTFKNSCIQCYAEFNSFNEPIVSKSKMKEIMSHHMEKFLSHHKLMSQMLTFDKTVKQKRNKHLVEMDYYDFIIFYKVLSLARGKKSQPCVL